MAEVVQGVGFNLRLRYLDEILRDKPQVAFWEVIAENLFENPEALALCEKIREDQPFALHCVGMNLAGTDALDSGYLAAIAELQERLDPFITSDHLCWQRHRGVSHHDLLPFPLNPANCSRVSARVQAVQEHLGRRIAVENLSYYVEYRASTLAEVDVMNEVAATSGCGLLLDLNNIEVNEANLGVSKLEYLERLDLDNVMEIHVAGGEEIDGVIIDTHGKVPTPFQHEALTHEALRGRPICYERDQHIPPLSESLELVEVLQGELDRSLPRTLEGPS